MLNQSFKIIATVITGVGRNLIESTGGFLIPSHLDTIWPPSLASVEMRKPILRILSQTELMMVALGREDQQQEGMLQSVLISVTTLNVIQRAYFGHFQHRTRQSCLLSCSISFHTNHRAKNTSNQCGLLTSREKRDGWLDESSSATSDLLDSPTASWSMSSVFLASHLRFVCGGAVSQSTSISKDF